MVFHKSARKFHVEIIYRSFTDRLILQKHSKKYDQPINFIQSMNEFFFNKILETVHKTKLILNPY